MDFFAWVEAVLLQIVRMVKQTKEWFAKTNIEGALNEIK